MELLIKPVAPFTTRHWRRAYSSFQDSSFFWNGEEILIGIDFPPRAGAIRIQEEGAPENPLLKVKWQGTFKKEEVHHIVSHVLSSNEPVIPFYQKFDKDPVMKNLIRKFSGTRMPRTRSFFEALVTTVLEQQVSMKVASTLRERFIKKFSSRKNLFEGRELYAFPLPKEVATSSTEELCQIGISRTKARTIFNFAQALKEGTLDPHSLSEENPQSIISFLTTFPGIGKWSAQFIVTRWLGPPDIFACSDLGVRKALSKLYLNGKMPTPLESEQFMERFSPWRRLAGFYLLLAYTGGGDA